MLRSVVGAVAANMMLVQCNSDVPISLACSIGVGNRPDHGIIGTASLGGPRRPEVRQSTLGGPASQATFSEGSSEQKSVSSFHMRRRMTPMRRASATIARLIHGGGQPVQPRF